MNLINTVQRTVTQQVTDDQQEQVRNRLLRRVDWRFLLPNPQPVRVRCFADGLLAAGVAAIAQQVVQGKPTQDAQDNADYDLAVAINPDQATLQQAWAVLQPGGACYTEWYSPLAGGPHGVRQRLKAWGFTDVRCYCPWPWPTHGNPLFWLPLEAPGALDYFLRNRPPSQSLGQRATRMLYQLTWRLSVRTRFIFPICAVAHRPAPDVGEAANQQWPTGEPSQRLSRLLLTGGQRSMNKVVGLCFADDAQTPQMVVKWPRVAESIPALQREAVTLRSVHALQPGGIAGAPQILFCHQDSTGMALGETALTGTPLWALLRRENFRTLALKATDWQVALARHSQPQPRTDWWARLVAPVLTEFEQHFGAVIDPAMLHQTHDLLATLDNLPLVCEQRDFSPWNVLIDDKGKLIVLDWESAVVEGLPLLDLLYFLTYLAIFLEGTMHSARAVESYHTMLDPTSFTGQVVAECLASYVTQSGIDPAMVQPLRLLLWLIHARSEYAHFAGDVGGVPSVEKLQQSIFIQFWAEEVKQATQASQGQVGIKVGKHAEAVKSKGNYATRS